MLEIGSWRLRLSGARGGRDDARRGRRGCRRRERNFGEGGESGFRWGNCLPIGGGESNEGANDDHADDADTP